jgi:preprotein translocase subunit SecE
MAAEEQMAKFSPVEFAQQVRQEFYKITWPTRKETTVTTAMVFVMVILAAIFFLLSDLIIGTLVDFVLGIGR